MKYYKNQEGTVVYSLDDNDDATVWLPLDVIQIQESEANTIRKSILAEAQMFPVITSVTMRQARLALLQAGLLSAVQTAMQSIEDDIERQAAQIEWEFAATVDRSSPFTQRMVQALGLSDSDVNNLFTTAASL